MIDSGVFCLQLLGASRNLLVHCDRTLFQVLGAFAEVPNHQMAQGCPWQIVTVLALLKKRDQSRHGTCIFDCLLPSPLTACPRFRFSPVKCPVALPDFCEFAPALSLSLEESDNEVGGEKQFPIVARNREHTENDVVLIL